MVTQMSLEGYCSSFPGVFLFCPPSGGQWGENSVMRRSLIGFKSVVFVFVRFVFSEIFFPGLVKSLKSFIVPSGQVLMELLLPLDFDTDAAAATVISHKIKGLGFLRSLLWFLRPLESPTAPEPWRNSFSTCTLPVLYASVICLLILISGCFPHFRFKNSESCAMFLETEKAFLKQPKVFLCSKKGGKGKRPGKGGNRFWKSIGLGFKTPRDAIEGTYIDKKCPFTGGVSIRGRILAGTCHSAKMMRTIIVRRNYLHYVKKYQRYEKRHSNIPAHISPCFRVKEGDHVIIGQCRPLSKTVRFNVLKVIPAGSSGGGGKKAFVAM
ncbi:40S ribosomal protein S11 [Vitis vinifera]|uniref:40S ribosomal protein S11 n=1 Tax=Vitis vinifera TaxID=29760 RepID=A0A438KF10_VITVI|nr:40S ribosomal protein S11 [Vitis vinifera]